jgi:quinol monooxygenase YgiN
MTRKGVPAIAALIVALVFNGPTHAQEKSVPHVRIAELDIDPAQIEAYKTALTEEVETSIRVEPGVLALYSVYEKDNPTHVRLLEIYADVDAYNTHIASSHFQNYKTGTLSMVRSLRLIETVPILLGAKPR